MCDCNGTMQSSFQHIQRRALLIECAALLLTSPLLFYFYGPQAGSRYLIGLLVALLAQQLFLWAMQRKIGPEISTLADGLTLARATAGSVLAGLVMADIEDRSGVAGWLAWSLSGLAATLSDWFDGPLARRRGPTRLGQVLDIEADSWLTLWSAAGTIVWGGCPGGVCWRPWSTMLTPSLPSGAETCLLGVTPGGVASPGLRRWSSSSRLWPRWLARCVIWSCSLLRCPSAARRTW
jgi:phosphatidylglycerophosphate synthase